MSLGVSVLLHPSSAYAEVPYSAAAPSPLGDLHFNPASRAQRQSPILWPRTWIPVPSWVLQGGVQRGLWGCRVTRLSPVSLAWSPPTSRCCASASSASIGTDIGCALGTPPVWVAG